MLWFTGELMITPDVQMCPDVLKGGDICGMSLKIIIKIKNRIITLTCAHALRYHMYSCGACVCATLCWWQEWLGAECVSGRFSRFEYWFCPLTSYIHTYIHTHSFVTTHAQVGDAEVGALSNHAKHER